MTDNSKQFTQGCHRICLPEETLAKASPHMAEMGITRIANVTGLDNIGIDVVTVCRPLSKAISVAQGKGLSPAAAKASGLMEAIETYHGEHIEKDVRLATYNALKDKYPVVDVNGLPKLSVSRFNPELKTLWIEGQDIVSDSPCYVPYEMVHCDYSLPLPTGSGSFVMSTNGLASGNSIEEAVSHGLCELIERDATSLWYLSRQQGKTWPLLDLKTVTSELCLELLDKFAKADVAVAVWDITSDINIPTFYAAIINRDNERHQPLYPAEGIGTHPSKDIALSRALTEAAQSRLTLISGSRDDIHTNSYDAAELKSIHQNYMTLMNDGMGQQDYRQIQDWQHDNVEDDVKLLTERLGNRGLNQIVIVDLSKPQFDIPVVRAIVPGLEGSHLVPGYQPGHRARQYLARNGL